MGTAPRIPEPWVSVSPARLQPGPISTVGAAAASAGGGSTGNQWTRIVVPSNEVTSQSLGKPATGVEAGTAVGGWQAVVAAATTVAEAVEARPEVLAQAVRSTARATVTIGTRQPPPPDPSSYTAAVCHRP